MSIAEFIREKVLRPRMEQAGVLVVYDADRRYRKVCLDLAGQKVRVIDASVSSIESREAALAALRDLAASPSTGQGILIYVPRSRPNREVEKQVDPFSIYLEAGEVFPRDDGDEYLSLCLRARPGDAAQIRQVFASSSEAPAFAVIDAIGNGTSWPQLRATLRVESGREILIALLALTEPQLQALKEQEGWVSEARDFLPQTVGLRLKTRGRTWSSMADELWRYLLFSEFVFDLPGALPDSLQGVPCALAEARPIVEDVCDQLRSDTKSRAIYLERATTIEKELNLREHCRGIDDLGERDTFPFEERTFLRVAIRGIASGNPNLTRRVLERQVSSIWQSREESREQWDLIRAAQSLVEGCEDLERQLPEQARSQAALLDFYQGSLREADRLQRDFEALAGGLIDPDGLLQEVIDFARMGYRRLAEKVQVVFVKHLEASGWPPAGRLANADVFDRLVADRLREQGCRVAYLMIDALRFELGVALEKSLLEDGPVELKAAYAQLPTITLVGMASLLPGARADLTLQLENEALLPTLAGVPVANVAQRMSLLSKRYGDRFQEMPLNEFTRGKPKIAETVDLLVLRSTEIDSQLESNPESTLRLIPGTLMLIRAALNKLRGMGFKEAIIATDHGFFLNAHAEAGDVCVKPQGAWPVNAHDRMMLGAGSSDSHSLVVSAEKVGIRGDFAQAAMPRTMAPYRSGHLYFHGGASLAEAVVPVLIARLEPAARSDKQGIKIKLNYKNGAKRITTRLPVIEVTMESEDLFSLQASVDVLLEAQDSKGNVVGEPRLGEDVNPLNRAVTLSDGQTRRIVLRMEDDFRGKFTVKALHPSTFALAAPKSEISLETDYTE
jgi:hypothetical protein